MKKNIRGIINKVLLGFLGLNALLIIIGLFVRVGVQISDGDNIFPSNASLLDFDTSRNYQRLKIEESIDSSQILYEQSYGKKALSWTTDESITFEVVSPKTGKFEIALDYYSLQESVTNISLNVLVNEDDKYENIELQTSWTDGNREEVFDIYRNEVVSVQKTVKIWRKSFLYEQRYYEQNPLGFTLKKGSNTITISKNAGELLLGDIFVFESSDFDNYEKPQTNDKAAKELITLEAENPLIKSTPEIRAQSVQDSQMTPYSTKYNKLNTISGDSFNKSGFSITYAFKVLKAGNYNISFKYSISQTNTTIYSKIFIDNIILNKQMNSYAFKAGGGFNNETLNKDGEVMEFYLSEGVHTITMQLDASLQSQVYYEMSNMINEISDLYLEVVKLTGGNTDKNKTWDIKQYIPTAQSRLTDWKTRLERLLELTTKISKSNPKKQNRLYQSIDNAYDKICSIERDPNSLPHKLNVLSEGSSSAAKMLSNSLHTATFSPISLDKIYIHGSEVKLPKANANFFMAYFATVQKILKSGVDSSDDEVVEIWVNRSTYYVSLMQQYADAYYTPKSGIKIRFSLLPDESKIVYANASGTNPDAALGVSAAVPYDLGIRGALVDMSKLEGFNNVISEYAPGSFTNMMECDKVYGLPETQDFNITFYRKDLLDKLGINVPQTYDEIIEIVPQLQRYGMNFYIPMAGGTGLKSISVTAPFIYQHGGDIYSQDFSKTAIDSKEAIAGITKMVELFSIYSLPLTAQNFYDSFRNGLIPIGVAGFDTYLQLTTAAPEIAGKWDVTLAPGVKQADGSINRINPGVGKGVVLFQKSKRTADAWDFIKWWLGSETQTSFANDIEAAYGPTFLWNTANLKAFKTISIADKHIEVIMEQWEQLYQIPQMPATYMVERGISDVWNKAVFDNVSVRTAISDAVIEINKEIKRKMIEFKYMNSNGEIIKKYYIPTLEEIKKWQRRW